MKRTMRKNPPGGDRAAGGAVRHDRRGGGGNNARRQRALAALLTTPSVAAAARAANIGLRCMWRYLGEADFRAALQARRSAALAQAQGLLAAAAAGAVARLMRAADSTDEWKAIAASRSLLSAAFQQQGQALPEVADDLVDGRPVVTVTIIDDSVLQPPKGASPEVLRRITPPLQLVEARRR